MPPQSFASPQVLPGLPVQPQPMPPQRPYQLTSTSPATAHYPPQQYAEAAVASEAALSFESLDLTDKQIDELEKPSENSMAITGILLGVVFAPLGMLLSILSLQRHRTKMARILAYAGVAVSCVGIMTMFAAAWGLYSSLATTRAHNQDMAVQVKAQALQPVLDSLFIKNGTYPSLAQLNDTNWRASNLIGTPDASLSPTALATALVSGTPTSKSFAYSVSPSTCDGTPARPCHSYTLLARQSTGTPYTVN